MVLVKLLVVRDGGGVGGGDDDDGADIVGMANLCFRFTKWKTK